MNGKIKIFLTTCFVLLLLTFSFLSFGHPQWNKYVYMWQAYVWPAKVANVVSAGPGEPYLELELYEPPKGYTGTWRIWTKEGDLESIRNYQQGKIEGPHTTFYKGELNKMYLWKNGKQITVYDPLNKIDLRSKYPHIHQ